MQIIREIFASRRSAGRPVLSFEFVPTKTAEGERTLMEKTIPALCALKPDYCSVTYGAGGSTREKTLGIVARIQNDLADGVSIDGISAGAAGNGAAIRDGFAS